MTNMRYGFVINKFNPICNSFIVLELVADVGMVYAENLFSRMRKFWIYFFSVEKSILNLALKRARALKTNFKFKYEH